MALGKEIRPLTGLRGIAALYVVCVHFFPGIVGRNALTTLFNHGYLAVDLFFTLSGFVMALNYGHMFAGGGSFTSYWTFLGRRIARIYPLYFAANCVACLWVIKGWVELYRIHPFGQMVLFNFAMVQTWGLCDSIDYPAWSISAEWAAYLLFPLLLVPALRGRALWAWLTAIVCGASLWAIAFRPLSNPQSPLDVFGFLHAAPVWRCLPEFTLGLLSFRLASHLSKFPVRGQRWAAPLLCVCIVALLMVPRADLGVVALFPLLLVSLSLGKSLPARLLSSPTAMFLGRISYSIYLIHGLMAPLMNWLHAWAAARALPHPQTCTAGVAFALTMLAAWAAYRLIELPGRRWLRHVFEGKSLARVSAELAPQTDSVPT